MIGRITWQQLDPNPESDQLVEAKAELSDDGQWTCPGDPSWQKLLNQMFSPRREEWSGPWMGRFGVAALLAAAKHLHAKTEVAPDPHPLPPGTVF